MIISYIRNTHNNLPETIQGIVWFMISAFWFAVMTAIIRYLAESGIHPFVMVLLRNIFGVMIMLPWLHRRGLKILKTSKFRVHFLRAAVGVFGMLAWFYAISKLPLAEAVSLSFTVPLFTTIAAMIFLKEQVGMHRWSALIVGFLGVLIIMRPGAENFNYACLLVVAATVTWSFSNILVKQLTKTEFPSVIVFYMSLSMIPLSLPAAIPFFTMPDIKELLLLILLAFTSVIAQFCVSHAYSRADISVLQPFDFSRLLFACLLGYFIFGETIDFWTVVGALIIFGSAVYISRRESQLLKDKITYDI